MPISINLLAEAQAAEEQRRRDPVKRTIWVAGFAVSLILLWSLSLQFRIINSNSDLKKQQDQWSAEEKKAGATTEYLKRTAAIEQKLAALQRLSTNRFYYGSTLNALQQTVVDNIQAVRVKTEQSYANVEAVPAKVAAGKTVPGKPAASVEKVTLIVEAKDLNPSDLNYNKYKEALTKFPYFQTNLLKADALRLTALSKPTADPGDSSRSYVMFTLEMQYPEISRNE